MPGAESFLRTVLCLEIFAERGLLTISRADKYITLRLTSDGKRVELDSSPYLRRLREGLEHTNRGGTP